MINSLLNYISLNNGIMTIKKLLAFTITIAVTTLYSCNNESKNKALDSVSKTTTNTNLLEIDTNAPEIELELIAKGNTMDDMEFIPKEFKVKAGTTVILTLINQSTDGAMQHNFVLIEDGNADKVGTFGVQAGVENNFVQEMKEVLVYTKMLKPGESTTLKFRAPNAGRYQFICTYPGHYSKMQGVFIVE